MAKKNNGMIPIIIGFYCDNGTFDPKKYRLHAYLAGEHQTHYNLSAGNTRDNAVFYELGEINDHEIDFTIIVWVEDKKVVGRRKSNAFKVVIAVRDYLDTDSPDNTIWISVREVDKDGRGNRLADKKIIINSGAPAPM